VVQELRDLGVLFDAKLSFVPHINCIAAKASGLLGLVNRTLKEFSVEAHKLLYCSIVRSVLEYASVVWSPTYLVYIHNIERIQNTFLRTCAWKLGYGGDDYTYGIIRDMLALDSLETKRSRNDLIFLFRLFNGFVDSPELLKLFYLNYPIRKLRTSPLLVTQSHRTNYGLFSPVARITREVNLHDIELFGLSLRNFKSKLNDIDL
jgi:hypothetical protein